MSRESQAPFRIYDATHPKERAEWESMWLAWPAREVHAHPGYVSLFCGSTSRPMCAAWQTDTGAVLFPFLLRELKGEAFCTSAASDAKDIVTPYGYGGAYSWGDAAAKGDEFWRAFTAWARNVSVVSEFVRLSLFPDSTVPYPGDVQVQQANVVRSLDLDESDLWSDVDHKVRKNVKRARSSGVRVEMDETGSRLDEFRRIYQATLGRRGASQTYYFSKSFFESIHAFLRGQFVYFHATINGTLVSTELVLISAERVYSFLGGTDSTSFDVRPNDLLKYEVMLWAKHNGKKAFVLGGGYAPGDGIFQYKKSFAPNGLVPFCVGRRVLDHRTYEDLVASRAALAGLTAESWSATARYFPVYRA